MLSGKISDFYLAGGTALSLYYLHHRQSQDLDFFTAQFSKKGIADIVRFISEGLKKEIRLIGEQAQDKRAKMAVYSVAINKKDYLKIDFVEDFLELIRKPKLVNGIKVMSLEDIYLRKIYAVTGTFFTEDSIGRTTTKGGRQDAKDFYDLYCLSYIFMRLSKFCFKYCNQLTREALIRWFRTYDRMAIKTGLLELKLRKDIDYKNMEQHFKKETDKILEKEVEFI